MAIVIGDTHGCFNTFMALLKKLPDDRIILTGDLIDRGPRVKELVQWILDHRDIQTVMGNHELFMKRAIDDPRFGYILDWLDNGGGQTLDSYHPGEKDISKRLELPEEHFNFLSNLPLYIEDGDLIVSHAAYSGEYIFPDEVIEESYRKSGILWSRAEPPAKIKDKFQIFGHTPYPEPYIGEHFVGIDTGAVFKGGPYGGILSAIQYPSMQIFTQENID